MNNSEGKYNPEAHLKLCVDLLFSKYSDSLPSDDLEVISNYFAYLGEHIDHRHFRVSGNKELVSAFESVLLLLQERLLLYPETIRKQVSEILAESKVGGTFAVVVNVPEQDIRSARLSEQLGFFGRMFLALFGRSLHLPIQEYGLTRESLFKAKIALSRLAQILRYAATIELVDYDAAFHDLKDHYDPDLIQKSKVVALINILRVHVDTLPDKNVSERITVRLGRLEEEIRKPKPRWGVIIAGFLALLGFLSDLKQLNPNIYTDSCHMVSQIVSVLYQDGSVAAAKSAPPLLSTTLSSSHGKREGDNTDPLGQISDDPPMALPPKREKDEDNVDLPAE